MSRQSLLFSTICTRQCDHSFWGFFCLLLSSHCRLRSCDVRDYTQLYTGNGDCNSGAYILSTLPTESSFSPHCDFYQCKKCPQVPLDDFSLWIHVCLQSAFLFLFPSKDFLVIHRIIFILSLYILSLVNNSHNSYYSHVSFPYWASFVLFIHPQKQRVTETDGLPVESMWEQFC